MKKICVLCLVIAFSQTLFAQEGSPANPQQQEAAQNTAGQMTAQDSLKQSIATLKTAFAGVNKLFVRKSDTISVMVSNIDYDNTNLSELKDAIKKEKNVRSVAMHYTGTTATMEVIYKGKPTDLWDNIPTTLKSAFKIAEIGDKNISLTYRQKTP